MIFCLCALLLPVPAAPDSPQTYTIDDIGSLGVNWPDDSHAVALNNRGHITGQYLNTNGQGYVTPRAYRWDGQVMTELTHGASQGVAINDDDVVVGFKKGSFGKNQAHRWTLLGNENIHVGTMNNSSAVRVNAQGYMAGSFDSEPGTPIPLQQPFLRLDAQTTVPLIFPDGSNAWAMDLNERGDLLGNVEQDDGLPRGFIRRHNGEIELLRDHNDVAFSAMRMNNLRQVAGLSVDQSGVWNPVVVSNAGIVSLERLAPQAEVFILDFADSGDAVGMADDGTGAFVAVRWTPDGKIDELERFLPVGSGWTLQSARGINALGEICGDGIHHGQARGWRMSPAAITPSITGVVGGLAGAHHSNTIHGRGFSPLGEVVIYAGFALGNSIEPQCLQQIGIASARSLGVAIADSEGRIAFPLQLPAGLAGHELHVQAVDQAACGLTSVASQGVF